MVAKSQENQMKEHTSTTPKHLFYESKTKSNQNPMKIEYSLNTTPELSRYLFKWVIPQIKT